MAPEHAHAHGRRRRPLHLHGVGGGSELTLEAELLESPPAGRGSAAEEGASSRRQHAAPHAAQTSATSTASWR